MAGRSDRGAVDFLLRFLVAHRLPIYAVGLILISVPLGVAWTFDVVLPEAVRTTIVAVSFGAILLTYLAERRVGLDPVDPATGSPREPYSGRARASFVLAVAGIAVGAYLILAGSAAMGLLFLAGALLFFQLAYRADRDGGDAPGG